MSSCQNLTLFRRFFSLYVLYMSLMYNIYIYHILIIKLFYVYYVSMFIIRDKVT